jgi:hypothetical protein
MKKPRCLARAFLAAAIFLLACRPVDAGRLVVNADDWTTHDGFFTASAETFTLNVFTWLTRSTPNARLLIDDQFDSSNPNYTLMLNALSRAGFTFVRAHTSTWSAGLLATFDAVLIELGTVDPILLRDYVFQGGGLYVVGGFTPSPSRYNPLLANFNLSLSPPTPGSFTVTQFAAHPVTNGVTALSTAGPTSINTTGPGPSIVSTQYGINFLAVWDGDDPPGAPGMPTISGAGNTVNINWTAPTTGGMPTDYTVLARLTPGGGVVASLPVGNVLGTSVAAPNGTFHVTVQASNASGPGPESPGVTFSVPILTPPPGAPTNLAVSVAGNQATFTWTPPTTGGAATGYLLVAALSPGGPSIAVLPFVPPTPAFTVQNIPPGTYFVRLAATNAGGAGPLSNEVVVSVSGPQSPGPPTMNPAVVSSGMVTLSWSAPTTGGPPAVYLVVASLTPGGPSIASLPVVGLGTTVPALSGSYFVRVHGVNAIGVGPASNEITVLVP